MEAATSCRDRTARVAIRGDGPVLAFVRRCDPILANRCLLFCVALFGRDFCSDAALDRSSEESRARHSLNIKRRAHSFCDRPLPSKTFGWGNSCFVSGHRLVRWSVGVRSRSMVQRRRRGESKRRCRAAISRIADWRYYCSLPHAKSMADFLISVASLPSSMALWIKSMMRSNTCDRTFPKPSVIINS